MESLTEDGDAVLAGRKENQKSLCLKRAQCLLVKADTVISQQHKTSESQPKVSQLSGCLPARTQLGFPCKIRSHRRMRIFICGLPVREAELHRSLS